MCLKLVVEKHPKKLNDFEHTPAFSSFFEAAGNID